MSLLCNLMDIKQNLKPTGTAANFSLPTARGFHNIQPYADFSLLTCKLQTARYKLISAEFHDLQSDPDFFHQILHDIKTKHRVKTYRFLF